MIETVSVNRDRKLVFLTIHNEEEDSGVRNPWSAFLIEGLRQNGCVAIVVHSPDKYEPPSDEVTVVPLFDLEFGLNRFSPVQMDASGVPIWARVFSSGFCVAVSKRCVALHSVMESSARQIAKMSKMFVRSSNNGDSVPNGYKLSEKRRDKKRRRAWRLPTHQRSALLWRGGK